MLWFLVAVLLVALFYWKIIKPHSYWTDRGVKQGKQTILLGDNAGTVFKTQSFAEMIDYCYKKFPEERYSGVYQILKPTLLLRDLDLIRQITIKDFDHFTDHMAFIPEGGDPLWTQNLFALKGERWRHMRATLSPAFTSHKMKAMFCLMSECAAQFTEHFAKQKEDVLTIELKDIFTRYTNDVIATCAFGVKCDSLRDRENEFYVMGKQATDFTGFWKNIMMMTYFIIPKLAKAVGAKMFDKHVADFFTKLVMDTVKTREEQNIVRPDMIHLLMEARKGQLNYEETHSSSNETGFATVEESDIGKSKKTYHMEITDVDMTAQALIFFFAGFDSVSTLMSFMGYELAVNPDIQERLRQEIKDTLREYDGKVTYEGLNKMQYLDMITAETLRKWPGATVADRVCIDSYTIPPTQPGETAVHLKKGDILWLPVYGIHHDPQYYPDPEKFIPERFSEENKAGIQPYSYLPFGVGPRNCIGSRFALLEAKTVIFHLLSQFEIVVTEKSTVPLKLSKASFAMNAEKGFWFGLKKRDL